MAKFRKWPGLAAHRNRPSTPNNTCRQPPLNNITMSPSERPLEANFEAASAQRGRGAERSSLDAKSPLFTLPWPPILSLVNASLMSPDWHSCPAAPTTSRHVIFRPFSPARMSRRLWQVVRPAQINRRAPKARREPSDAKATDRTSCAGPTCSSTPSCQGCCPARWRPQRTRRPVKQRSSSRAGSRAYPSRPARPQA